MPFTLILNEDNLFTMPQSLRDELLRWYFGRPRSVPPISPASPAPIQSPPSTVDEIPNHATRRLTFPELVRAGLLNRGDEIYCRSLKRQQKKGAEPFIKGAVVTADGRIEFQKRSHASPSKLAVAMINASGGKTPAVNGYDYLFVKNDTGTISLDSLRRKLLGEDPVEEGLIDDVMKEFPDAFGSRVEARRYLQRNPMR